MSKYDGPFLVPAKHMNTGLRARRAVSHVEDFDNFLGKHENELAVGYDEQADVCF